VVPAVTYTALAVLGALAVIALDFIAGTRLLRTRAFWVAYLIMLLFQLIVNGVLTGIPVVKYAPSGIIGWRIAFAPVEDLLFGFALITLTLVVWVRVTRPRAAQPERRTRTARRNPPSPTAARRPSPTDTRSEKTS
jgi:lycopene cyclase domain-containing protein